MDNQQEYFKDSVTLIVELLKDTLGSQITSYYEGFPQSTPAESAFPVLSVYKTEGDFDLGATQTDDVTENITIAILTNRLIWAGAPENIDTPMRHLQKLVEGRDPNQPANYGQYMPNTVIGALRTHLTLGTYTVDSKIRVHYDSVTRANEPQLAECDLILSLTEHVHVPNRS